jgi:CheY-like chemotaxis protein
MPVMDGFSLCRECKKDPELKQVPLVFYTEVLAIFHGHLMRNCLM